MSLNDELLMELLDGEVPEEFRERVEKQISENAQESMRYNRFQAVKSMMDGGDEPDFEVSRAKVRDRIQRTIGAREHIKEQGGKKSSRILDFSRGSITLPVPAAAAAAVLFISAVVFNFFPSTGSVQPAVAESQQNYEFDVASYSEYRNLSTSLSGESGTGGFSASISSEASPGVATESLGALSTEEGINLQINVRDLEQLLYLLQGTQTLGGTINELTIQLPDENQFELLGESQLRKATVGEAQ